MGVELGRGEPLALAVPLPAELHARARTAAVAEGVTLAEFVARAVEAALADGSGE